MQSMHWMLMTVVLLCGLVTHTAKSMWPTSWQPWFKSSLPLATFQRIFEQELAADHISATTSRGHHTNLQCSWCKAGMEGAPTRREGPSRIAQQRAQRSCGSQYVTGRRSERSCDLAYILTDPSFLYPRLTSCYILKIVEQSLNIVIRVQTSTV